MRYDSFRLPTRAIENLDRSVEHDEEAKIPIPFRDDGLAGDDGAYGATLPQYVDVRRREDGERNVTIACHGMRSDLDVVDVTPAPIFTRFERLNDRVLHRVEMAAGVLVR